jgi:hypothetical protein
MVSISTSTSKTTTKTTVPQLGRVYIKPTETAPKNIPSQVVTSMPSQSTANVSNLPSGSSAKLHKGSSSQQQATQTYVTKDTGTGYNPATGVNEGSPQPTIPIYDTPGYQPKFTKTPQQVAGANMGNSPQQYGALFVTPKEAQQIKGKSQIDIPYWELTNTDLNQGVREAQYAGSIPVAPGTQTKGAYISTKKSILMGKDIFAGKEYNSVVASGDTYTRQARNAYLSELSGYQKFRYTTSDVSVGIIKGGVGIAEGGLNLFKNVGQYQFKSNGQTSGKSVNLDFNFGGTNLKAYPTTPTVNLFSWEGVGQRLTEPQTLGQATLFVPATIAIGGSAISNIGKGGWAEGLKTTAGAFSPIRPTPGVYGSFKPTTTFENAKAYKINPTTRIIPETTNQAGRIKLSLVEQINTGGSVKGMVYTKSPLLKITPAGDVYTGTQFTETQYFGTSPSTGKGFSMRTAGDTLFVNTYGEAGVNKVVSMPTKSVTTFGKEVTFDFGKPGKVYVSKGGGVSKDIVPGLKSFKSGVATPEYKYTPKIYAGKRGFEYSPTGKYSVSPRIKGVEFSNVNPSTDKGFTITQGGGTKTPFSKTFGTGTTEFQTQVFKPTTETFTSTPGAGVTIAPEVTPKVLTTTTSPALFTMSKSSQLQYPTSSTILAPSESTKEKSSQVLVPSLITPTRTGSKSYSGVAQVPAITTKLETPTVTRQPTPTFTPYPYIGNPRPQEETGGGILFPPLPNFDFGGLGTRRFKGKRKLGYSPDFRSLALGITGKAPKKLGNFGYGEQARPIVGTKKKSGFLKRMDERIKTNFKIKAKNWANRFRSRK